MRNRPGSLLTMLTAATAAAAIGTIMSMATAAPARSAVVAAPVLCKSAKRPKLAASLSRSLQRAIQHRNSYLGFAVSDPALDLTCSLHDTWKFDAASTIKVTIISALLLKEGGPTHLTKTQRSLAWLMITQSNNDAATDLWNDVGMTDMQRFLNRAHMKHTALNEAWGLTSETAQDELTLLRLLANPGKVLSSASRGYVLWLMDHVISSERWGVPAGAPSRLTVAVKNGWLPYPDGDDWHVNSLGVFRGHHVLYEIAMLTRGNSSEAYGIGTIQGAAEQINRAIARS
jgi:beta-lactamase family protein